MNISSDISLRSLEKRVLLLPLIWAVFGIGEVYALRYLFGDIANIAPTIPNDKPIGGSVLPVVFSNSAALIAVLGASLYSVGIWKPDLSSKKTRIDIIALAILLASGLLLWYSPIALFTGIVSLVYFVATSLD